MGKLGIRESLFWMGGTSFLGQLVTWAITIIVARLLTPADYGLVTLSGLFTVFAQMVSEMGIGAAVIQSDEISQSQVRTLYAYSIIMGVGMMGAGVVLGGPFMAWIFNAPQLEGLVQFSSLVFLIAAAKSMPRNLLAREFRFDSIAKVETVSRILTSFCTLGLVLAGFGVWSLAAQWLFIEFFQLIAFVKLKKVAPSFKATFVEIRPLLSFGLNLVARNILYQLYNLSDGFVVGKLASQSFLGGYSFAKQLTNMPFEKVLKIINQVLFPYFSRDKKNLSKIGGWTTKAIELQLLILVPFYIFLFFSAREVIILLMGPGWEIAVYPLKILCIANVFKLSESYSTNILTALGKLREQLVYVMLLFISISGGMLIVAINYNIETAILVWVSVYPLIIISLTKFTLLSVDLSFLIIIKDVKYIIISLFSLAISLFLISFIVFHSLWATLAIKITIGCLFYSVPLFLLNRGKLINCYSLFFRK